MIANTTITITENPTGAKHYEYLLGNGDIYYIGHRWLVNCGLSIPTKKCLLVFGGKVLVVIDNRPWVSCIKAIEAKGLWLFRYRISVIWKRITKKLNEHSHR